MKSLRFAVIGMPVAHSKSPVMQGAAFRALGLPHTFETLETSAAEVESRVQALRKGTFAGLNVTVPHKQAVLEYVDEIDPSALAVGAANTLARDESGRVVAHNTDVGALASELTRLTAGRARRSTTALVLGPGGAARAAVRALVMLGFGKIEIRGRTPKKIDIGGLALDVQPLVAPPSEDPHLACIIQATSCGMVGADPGEIVADAVAWDTVPTSAVAFDVVYAPLETPFLVRARSRGLTCGNGLRMLALQGALALRLWLGVDPPLDVMLTALHGPVS